MYNDDPLTWGLNESDLESSSDENTVKNDILEKNVAKTGNAIDENPSPVISEEKLDCQPPSLASNDCLPGVSPDMWRKFKELQKKNQEMRRKTQHRERRRRAKRRQKTDDSGSSSREENRERQAEREAHWNGLTQYFGVNDRFEAPACSRPQPETGLEKNLDCAIAEGDFGKADDLSDRLATREAFRQTP